MNRLPTRCHVREIVEWHFNPETGCPLWLDFASKLGWDPRSTPPTTSGSSRQDEWLRGEPVRRCCCTQLPWEGRGVRRLVFSTLKGLWLSPTDTARPIPHHACGVVREARLENQLAVMCVLLDDVVLYSLEIGWTHREVRIPALPLEVTKARRSLLSTRDSRHVSIP